MRRSLLASAIVVGAIVALASIPASPRAAAGRCTITDVFYDVTAIKLDERMTAHWDYDDEDGDPASTPRSTPC